MSQLLHILRAQGHYIGQVRPSGHRNYETVTRECKTPELALAKLAPRMLGMKRGRVLFIDSTGWYGANVVMEVTR